MTDVLQIQIRILVQSLLWCCFSLLIFTPRTTADPVILSLLLLIKGNQGYTDFLEAKYKEEKKKKRKWSSSRLMHKPVIQELPQI